jgi:peptidoglycan/xylan/chitin deacetylase (PgdA/CDA1 family)
MKLPRHDRYDYVPLVDRKQFDWPAGKRLAVYVCNNIEHFAFLAGMGSDSATGHAPQTQRNYAWRDYGNRIGIWRLWELADELKLPLAHNCNSAALDACPQIAARIRARGDEIIGHGRTNAERSADFWEEDEARSIVETTEALTRHGGKRPSGWLSPYLAQSRTTLDVLKLQGYRYCMDWPCDDQPFFMRTAHGPMLSVPYPIEVNDSPALIFRQHSAREFADMIVDQFEMMLKQSASHAVVCGIVLHSFVVGQPFRLKPLEQALRHILAQRERVWLTTPGAIADYALALPKGTLAGD